MLKAWPLWLLMLLAAVVLPVSLSACSNNDSGGDGGNGDDANDGTDQDGDRISNGVYFYKVIARAEVNNELKTTESISKIVVSR